MVNPAATRTIKAGRDFLLKIWRRRRAKNFILSELLKLDIGRINFWQTKDDAEVDFVIQKKDQIVPIEVKSGAGTKSYLSRSLHSFINKYEPKIAELMMTGFLTFFEQPIQVGDPHVCHKPVYLPPYNRLPSRSHSFKIDAVDKSLDKFLSFTGDLPGPRGLFENIEIVFGKIHVVNIT